MKPRIRLIRGVWVCGYLAWNGWMVRPLGHGHSPREALKDWKEQWQCLSA